MGTKDQILKKAKLYLILDAQVNTYEELLQIASVAVNNGVNIIQLRDKFSEAQEVLEFSRRIKKVLRNRIPFILNDRVDLALAVGADGVHLGRNDLSITFARKMMGSRAIIGASCQRWAHVQKAQQEGADYIGFGSVFRTKTKPKRSPMDLALLRRVVARAEVPVFAIGGINQRRVPLLRREGVQRIAVCRDICLAKDIDKVLKEFRGLLSEGSC